MLQCHFYTAGLAVYITLGVRIQVRPIQAVKAMNRPYLALLLAVTCIQSNAQDSPAFNQRLGACDAQKAAGPRAKCFEQLARDAVAKLDQVVAAPQSPAVKEPPAPPAPIGKYADFVVKAKGNITSSLRDPSSVQWRGLFVSGSKMPALCGEMNGKNAYGAYIGFRRFYATTEKLLTEIENPRDNFVFNGMWPKVCNEETEKVE